MHAAEFLYHLGFSVKQHCSLRNRRRLPCKVISIGNITVGGTGKTPAAIALAEEALRRGLLPIILTRGYKGTATGPCFVTKGEGPLLSPAEAGDEPFLMAERLKGVPVVKCRTRYEGGIYALQELGIPDSEFGRHLFILDDGFQHRSLFRDADIVLVDAGDPFGRGRLLPLGRLREPISALGRADIVLLTKTAIADEGGRYKVADLQKEIRAHARRSAIFLAEHSPRSLRFPGGDQKPPEWISGQRIFGFCGLGSPESFRKTLCLLGAEIVGFRSFRDHYTYRSGDIAAIKAEAERRGARWIVTTEKDIIKARSLDLPDNVVVLTIAFSVEDGFYASVFGR